VTVANFKFLALDEERYFLSQGVRVQDEDYGRLLLENLRVKDRAYVTNDGNYDIFIEAFDEPFVARHVEIIEAQKFLIQLPYGYEAQFLAETLHLDRWDRMHGRTDKGIPFIMSRSAQMEFFNYLTDYDDDSITIDKTKIPTLTLDDADTAKSQAQGETFWNNKYQEWNANGQAPGWELEQPTPALTHVLPQLKIPKGRWAVLGSGTGNDAAHLAAQGHLVTSVDISSLAIERAQKKHANLGSARWVEADAFSFAQKNRGEFDYIFEHTFFCAVDPVRRADVVKAWKQLLAPGGHLLAVFFVMDRGEGPPFGASEWEIRELLKKDFQFLYWTRWRHSVPARQGKELVVYARRLSND
jgi:SAM-dependent methyltransferase